jgi:hypothetical protein
MLESSLQALAERIEEVRSAHDKLESENKLLQAYIGRLTRKISASRATLDRTPEIMDTGTIATPINGLFRRERSLP